MSKFLDSLGLRRLINKLKSRNIDGMGLSTNDFSNADKSKLDSLALQVPSNWNETNSNSKAFIQNKPTKLSQFTNDPNFVKNSEIDNIIAEKMTDLLEIVIDSEYYNTVINTTDGLINKGIYHVTCNVSRTDYHNRGLGIKYIRLTTSDGKISTILNMVYNYPSANVFCGYCFNKLNDTQIGIGYATIRYEEEYKLKIDSIRSTLKID